MSLCSDTTPRMTLARSFACIANQEWEAREDPKRPKGVWNVDAIYRACAFCQKAIEHGLTPRLAPCIGHMVEKTGLRRWEDMRRLGASTTGGGLDGSGRRWARIREGAGGLYADVEESRASVQGGVDGGGRRRMRRVHAD